MADDDNIFAETIIETIQSELSSQPAPVQCTVTKTYDNQHVDVITDDGSELENIPCVCGNAVDSTGILIFTDNDANNPIAIVDDNIKSIIRKFGLNQPSSDKFNYAVIKKETTNITYEEFWILSNAYYDYDLKRFIKIDETHTSFGIQIQANGTYPGEAELGYNDNVGINIWRNPKKSDVELSFPNWRTDTVNDFYPFMEHNQIGLGSKTDETYWKEYAVFPGWNNSFMIDSYGGMTVGGAGFEIDGNGLFPFTRLTHSIATINNQQYALVGVLDNAYHAGSGCDDNSTYSWFFGFKGTTMIA